MFFHSFIAMECVYLFFTVNSSVNAARSSLNGVCRRKFHEKGIKLKAFPQGYVISLCGVVVRYNRVEPRVPGQSFTQYVIFFFPVFCVVVFAPNGISPRGRSPVEVL